MKIDRFVSGIALVASAAWIPACSGAADDGGGTSEQADTGGIGENTPQARAILKLVNESSRQLLHEGVGLSELVADLIVTYRDGSGGEPGKKFETLAELDAIPYVGPVQFKQLLDYALAHHLVVNACKSDGDCAGGACVHAICVSMTDEKLPDATTHYIWLEASVDARGRAWALVQENGFSHNNKALTFVRDNGWGGGGAQIAYDGLSLVPMGDSVVAAGRDEVYGAIHLGGGTCSPPSKKVTTSGYAVGPDGTPWIVYQSEREQGFQTIEEIYLCNGNTHTNDLVTNGSWGATLGIRFDTAGAPQVLVDVGTAVVRYKKHVDSWEPTTLYQGPGTHPAGMLVRSLGPTTHIVFGTYAFDSDPSVGNLAAVDLRVTDDGLVGTASLPFGGYGAQIDGAAVDPAGNAYALVTATRDSAWNRTAPPRYASHVAKVALDGTVQDSVIANYEHGIWPSYSLAAGDGALYLLFTNGQTPAVMRVITPR